MNLAPGFVDLPSTFVGINKGKASQVRTFTVAFWASPGAIPPRLSTLAKKDVSEMLKTLESEIRVKMEAALLDARHSVMEQSNS